jgi:hypothetical protein
LSIAGIFKEVSTITVSAWVFGDELTRLNILGVVVAICGRCPVKGTIPALWMILWHRLG